MAESEAGRMVHIVSQEERKAGRDTKHRHLMREVSLSEEPYRLLVELTADAVFCYEHDPAIPTRLTVDEQVSRMYGSVLVNCNDACARVYGATRPDEVIGKKLVELFGTTGGTLDDLFRGFIEGGYQTTEAEGAEVLPDGTKRYYLNNAVGFIENNALVRVWGTYRDITERMQNEEQLRESIDRFELAVRATNDGIWERNIQTDEVYFSPRWKQMLGYREDEFSPTRDAFINSIHPDDRDRLQKAGEAHLTHRTRYDMEIRMRHKSGKFVWVRSRGQATWNDAGEPLRVAGSISDITAQRMAEEEVIVIGERERTRIGHDLHDGLGQELTGISLGLEALAQQVAVAQLPDLQVVQNLKAMTQKSISETRLIARSLSPGFASELGIVEALRSLANEVNEHSGMKCRVRCPDESNVQDAEVATHLYRIAQEGINNALKHSSAQNIELHF